MKLSRESKKKICKSIMLIFAVSIISTLLFNVTSKAAVKINKKKVTMYSGEKTQLIITGSRKKVKWRSSNKKICKVNKKGLVTAKKKGKATIKAKVGKKTLKCIVKVKNRPKRVIPNNNNNNASNTNVPVSVTGLQINGAQKVLAPGGTMNLSVSFIPANAAPMAVKWKTSSKNIATVKNGTVNAVDTGKVTISAWIDKDNDDYIDKGEISATYDITVKDIKASCNVDSFDKGDLLLSDGNAKAVLSYTLSDTVTDVTVNILDGMGTVIRTYSVGNLAADTDMSCTWDLTDSNGTRVPAGNYCFQVVAAGAQTKSDYFTVYVDSEFGTGNGSPESPYLVSNIEQLKLVNMHNGRCFKQTANIDFNLGSFMPLFTWDVPFTGTYDGGGYTISNISSMMKSDHIGIFSNIGKTGTVRNMVVENSYFGGATDVAVIAGGNSGTISGCKVKLCSVNASGTYGAIIVGDNSGTVKDCSIENNTVVSRGYDALSGGICGINRGTVTGCTSSNDTITATAESSGWACAGGIVGDNIGNIISCNVNGAMVKAEHGYLGDSNSGGVAGANSGTVSLCNVSDSTIEADGAGGIIGYNKGNNVNNTYSGPLNQIG